MTPEFVPFPKIPRLSREILITEKIDGTNGCLHITENLELHVGSRSRWIAPEQDNHGFASWAYAHRDELVEGLGPGTHFGEWWGQGIQRGYGLKEKRFSLFNVARWADERPACCHVVPTIYRGPMSESAWQDALADLAVNGSRAAPGFMQPEGIILFHTALGAGFKKTLLKDEEWKGKAA